MTYIYFIVEIIIFLLFFYSKDKGKQHEEYGMIMACCLWAMVFGLRAYTVGNDTFSYYLFYENKGTPGVGYGTVDFPGKTIEIGFVIVCRILRSISGDATFFFSIVSFSFCFFLYKFYRICCKSNMIWCLLLLNVISLGFIGCMSMVRQTVSISILLLSLYFFYLFLAKKQNGGKNFTNVFIVISLVLAIFSVIVHRTSMLIFGLLLLLPFWKNSRNVSYAIIVGSFVISIFYEKMIADFMNVVLSGISLLEEDKVALLGDRYMNTASDTGGMSIIRELSYVVPLLVTIKNTSEEEINTFSFKCLIVAFSILMLLSTSYMMNRLSIVFLLLGMCKFVPASAMFKGSKLFYFYILVTIYYMWRAFVAYGKWPITDSTLPYYFFWQQ